MEGYRVIEWKLTERTNENKSAIYGKVLSVLSVRGS